METTEVVSAIKRITERQWFKRLSFRFLLLQVLFG